MNTYFQWTKYFFISLIFFSTIISLLNYIVDPFQYYRLSTWYKFPKNKQRFVMPGLIKNLNYDIAIVGSSMTENYSTELGDDLFEGKSALFPVVAASAYELKNMVQLIFENNNKLDKIFINLDFFAFSNNPTHLSDPAFPIHMYDQNHFNDLKYLFNRETLRQTLKSITKYRGLPHKQKKLWYWSDQINFSEQTVINSLIEHPSKRMFFNKDGYTLDQFIASFNFNIYPFLIKHQNTTFYLIFPPYSNLFYVEMEHGKWFNDAMRFKRHIINATANLSNVKIYDFQCVNKITSNLNNYKDMGHHSGAINDYIMESIHQKNHQITSRNLEDCIKITNDITKDSQWNRMYEHFIYIK